jgi:hypothetical protein
MASRNSINQSDHDKAVRLLAVRWADPSRYNISVNPNGQKNFFVGPTNYPVVAWTVQGGRNVAVWIVEVETSDSVDEAEARQWLRYSATGVPLSLAVPVGSGSTALEISRRVGVSVAKVFEYQVVGGRIVVTDVR